MSHPRAHRLPAALIVTGVLLFLAVAALLVYAVGHVTDPDRDTLPSALIGKPAPDFDLPLLHDAATRIRASELRGAPYVLNVWGSWCPACQAEHPVLSRFALSKRVRVIGYNWKDEPDDALQWLDRLGNPFLLVLADRDGRTALDWGISAAPETFLIDANGIVRWKHSGALTEAVIQRQLLPTLSDIERAAATPPVTHPAP